MLISYNFVQSGHYRYVIAQRWGEVRLTVLGLWAKQLRRYF